ncbi:MAG: acylphosphatase [Gammaproteobacteria bacterium]|nr:acylphosphatase [Gammaproteobacteria bacterium]
MLFSKNKICIHAFITGHVQGVYFRAHTEQEAVRLGLTGWVKNCPDLRVEVMACGSQSSIAQLLHWLKQGPPSAVVNEMHSEECEWQEFPDFRIIR